MISILSLLTCIFVTFAWINEMQNPEGRVMALRLNDASVASSELMVKLYANVEGETFDDITKLCDESDAKELESYDNFAPGSRKKFRVDITNLSNSPLTLRMILSDIICENEELQNSIIIGTNGFDGFNTEYQAPAVENKRLADGMDSNGGFILVESVEIPPNNVDKPVSIYFYVMFAASGSEALEDMSFSIGTINFLTL
jgi:hypothetical protein